MTPEAYRASAVSWIEAVNGLRYCFLIAVRRHERGDLPSNPGSKAAGVGLLGDGSKSQSLGTFERAAGSVAYVEDVDVLALYGDTVDDPVDMRLVAVEEMAEPGVLRRLGTAVRLVFEAQVGFLQPVVPLEGGAEAAGVDCIIEE